MTFTLISKFDDDGILGQTSTDSEIADMVREADTDGDGKIQYNGTCLAVSPFHNLTRLI